MFKINRKNEPVEKTRIRREIVFIFIAVILIVISTVIETRMLSLSSISITSKIIVYAYINATIVLFILMLFLVVRNAIKLFLERRKNITGSRLRTKLVILFVIVSLAPSFLMFIVIIASGFAANTINKWYSPKIERSVGYTIKIARYYHKHGNAPKNEKINKMIQSLSHFYTEYSQIRFIKNPIETTYLILFSTFTLLILFISSWVGFYLSKKLTKPIIDLVDGTEKVAGGELDINIPVSSDDEIGILVNSFNKMTKDLRKNKEFIERANFNLKTINEEIERRRKYMEIILKNIKTGVVTIDSTGKLRTINYAAEAMLEVSSNESLNKNYKDVFNKMTFSAIRDIIKNLAKENQQESITKEIKLNIKDKLNVYIINVTVMKDELSNYIGFVIVINDTTDMIKAQRIAAWEEVAKRMAHEIKNPLTPIKLSAQRLKRKFEGKLQHDSQIFNDSVDTIIKEVDGLKNLVDEFSLYARLPKINFDNVKINLLLNESITLYKNAHKNIQFIELFDENMPLLYIDKLQMKRAFMNILDNAVYSINMKQRRGKGKDNNVITIRTIFDKDRQTSIIKFSDTGTGIDIEYLQNIFEPYFSTKKGGTGLGLAITKNIVTENHGTITVQNIIDGGAEFIIELNLA